MCPLVSSYPARTQTPADSIRREFIFPPNKFKLLLLGEAETPPLFRHENKRQAVLSIKHALAGFSLEEKKDDRDNYPGTKGVLCAPT